jgi:hypothetical protein
VRYGSELGVLARDFATTKVHSKLVKDGWNGTTPWKSFGAWCSMTAEKQFVYIVALRDNV